MRQRDAREYQPGALWQTQEQEPRYLRVLGRVAIDDTMLLAELDGLERVWLQRATGRVYRQGVLLATAECVGLGDERAVSFDRGEVAGGSPGW